MIWKPLLGSINVKGPQLKNPKSWYLSPNLESILCKESNGTAKLKMFSTMTCCSLLEITDGGNCLDGITTFDSKLKSSSENLCLQSCRKITQSFGYHFYLTLTWTLVKKMEKIGLGAQRWSRLRILLLARDDSRDQMLLQQIFWSQPGLCASPTWSPPTQSKWIKNIGKTNFPWKYTSPYS